MPAYPPSIEQLQVPFINRLTEDRILFRHARELLALHELRSQTTRCFRLLRLPCTAGCTLYIHGNVATELRAERLRDLRARRRLAGQALEAHGWYVEDNLAGLGLGDGADLQEYGHAGG